MLINIAMERPPLDLDKYDDLIESSTVLSKANDRIEIYTGIFSIRKDEFTESIDGKLFLKWFPSVKVVFCGQVTSESSPIIEMDLNTRFDLLIGVDKVG